MAVYLEEFVETLDNLPSEMKHFLAEIKSRDDQIFELKKLIISAEKRYLVGKSSTFDVHGAYVQCLDLSDEKMFMVDKSMELLSRHIKKLDEIIDEAAKNVDEPTMNQMVDQFAPEKRKRIRDKKGRRSGGPRFHANGTDEEIDDGDEEGGEPVYCICQRISFGAMVGCDNNETCPYEWFHYDCVGLTAPPQGIWYCPICAPKMKKKKIS